jgi:hypothetical protein
MRRLLLTSLLAALLTVGLCSAAQATRYVGQADGVRVVLRVKGSKVVAANVFARLYCTIFEGGHHLNRVHRTYATPESPLKIDPTGLFRWKSPGGLQEEGFEEEEELIGHVRRRVVTGSFEYRISHSGGHRSVRCQTGSFTPRNARVQFRARRRLPQAQSGASSASS